MNDPPWLEFLDLVEDLRKAQREYLAVKRKKQTSFRLFDRLRDLESAVDQRITTLKRAHARGLETPLPLR